MSCEFILPKVLLCCLFGFSVDLLFQVFGVVATCFWTVILMFSLQAPNLLAISFRWLVPTGDAFTVSLPFVAFPVLIWSAGNSDPFYSKLESSFPSSSLELLCKLKTQERALVLPPLSIIYQLCIMRTRGTVSRAFLSQLELWTQSQSIGLSWDRNTLIMWSEVLHSAFWPISDI